MLFCNCNYCNLKLAFFAIVISFCSKLNFQLNPTDNVKNMTLLYDFNCLIYSLECQDHILKADADNNLSNICNTKCSVVGKPAFVKLRLTAL